MYKSDVVVMKYILLISHLLMIPIRLKIMYFNFQCICIPMNNILVSPITTQQYMGC